MKPAIRQALTIGLPLALADCMSDLLATPPWSGPRATSLDCCLDRAVARPPRGTRAVRPRRVALLVVAAYLAFALFVFAVGAVVLPPMFFDAY